MAAPKADTRPRVPGVVLAAGSSSRFGGVLPKQLHQIDGEAMVARVVRVALRSNLDRIVVVTGHHAAEVETALSGLAVEVVENPAFANGQSTSVRAGLSWVSSDADAAMFIPCDLPNLDTATIDRLIVVYRESGGSIVLPVVAGDRRAPVVIDRSLFAELEGLTGDQGARQLFSQHEAEIVEVQFERGRPFEDLDRP